MSGLKAGNTGDFLAFCAFCINVHACSKLQKTLAYPEAIITNKTSSGKKRIPREDHKKSAAL